MSESLTLTAVFTPDENGWTMAQLAEWPAVVTCGRTVEEAREMLLDAAREMIASYRDEGREPPIGGGHAEQVTIDLAAARGASSSNVISSTTGAKSCAREPINDLASPDARYTRTRSPPPRDSDRNGPSDLPPAVGSTATRPTLTGAVTAAWASVRE